jgi:hypothetical protein
MHDVPRLGVLLLLWGCGGEQLATTTGPPDGAQTATPLFRRQIPFAASQPAGQANLTITCLDAGLPVGDNGLPNCVVVSANLPAGSSTADEVAACQLCNAPGLAPFIAPVPLESIGEGLSGYQCLCAVAPIASSDRCPPYEGSNASWCYATPDSGEPDPCDRPRLGFTAAVDAGAAWAGAGVLYIACFEPQTAQ